VPRRCKRCVYVFDQDEWICERCGGEPPKGVTLVVGDDEPGGLSVFIDEEDLHPARYDRDELGRDPEEDD
jgi:hypothetical protein